MARNAMLAVVTASIVLSILTGCTSASPWVEGHPVHQVNGTYTHTSPAGEEKHDFNLNDKAAKLLIRLEEENTKRIKLQEKTKQKQAEAAAELREKELEASRPVVINPDYYGYNTGPVVTRVIEPTRFRQARVRHQHRRDCPSNCSRQ